MMELLLKVSGFGWISKLVNGYKVYIAGISKMLTGIAAMVGALASLLPHFQTGEGLSGVVSVLRSAEFPIAKGAIIAGWVLFHDGLGLIGQRHALAKAVSAEVVADLKP